MKVSIGKNTLGGGKKMTTSLRNYNRSTHDLSFIFRSSMAPGVLVPSMKSKMLPGDTFPIKTRCHTLTHPTIGPLFGSFKQQNDFFFCPDRLYNAMLHNNALNVGLKMSEVKFPLMHFNPTNNQDGKTWNSDSYIEGSNDSIKNQIHPSSLLAYLGYKCAEREVSEGNQYEWQCVPVLAYFDIFKNYYANKQEKNFYTIGASGTLNPDTSKTDPGYYWGIYKRTEENGAVTEVARFPGNNVQSAITIPEGETYYIGLTIKSTSPIYPNQTNVEIGQLRLDGHRYGKIQGTCQDLINSEFFEGPITDVGTNTSSYDITYLIKNSGKTGLSSYRFSIAGTKIQNLGTLYNSYELTEIDEMREKILQTPRQNIFNANNARFIGDMLKNIPDGEKYVKPACANPMVGLCLKTYQSDINVNWVNTEWIDGDNGINAITAIDTSSGSFTIDQLNLAQKVYNMLNRIAVSDGSYNAWIQTVYTSGGLNHIETPLYLGGSSLEIEFQEVINNSGTEDQPLGSLAGRGIATNHKGGDIIFKADEPGYIICITSITPRVDYFQGNDWDCYLENMDELHKPQLDGIGFQDRLYRHLNASATPTDLNKSIGKQPAWIEYMTNVNKTFGNFALIENEGWMCLNRIFGNIDSYTTYIFPHMYNNIFADTDITAQNFWVQIGFNTHPRRVMSAKQIPNI